MGIDSQAERIARLLARLAEEKFFGTVVLTVQSGKVHTVKIDKVLKIEEI